MITVLLTGGTSGLGLELAKLLAPNFNLAICSSSDYRTQDAIATLANYKESVYVDKCDVSNPAEVQKFVSTVEQKFGTVDILINNAGIYAYSKIIDSDIETLQKVMAINFTGAYNMIKYTVPQMIEKKSGIVVNISSVAAEKVFSGNMIYSASKAAMNTLTDTLREEVRQHGIKVIKVIPGAIATPIWSQQSLEKNSEKMMSSRTAAEIIYNNIIFSIKNKIALETLQIRPVGGDL